MNFKNFSIGLWQAVQFFNFNAFSIIRLLLIFLSMINFISASLFIVDQHSSQTVSTHGKQTILLRFILQLVHMVFIVAKCLAPTISLRVKFLIFFGDSGSSRSTVDPPLANCRFFRGFEQKTFQSAHSVEVIRHRYC